MSITVMLCRKQLERRPQLRPEIEKQLRPEEALLLPVPCLRLCTTCATYPVARVDGAPVEAAQEPALAAAIQSHLHMLNSDP